MKQEKKKAKAARGEPTQQNRFKELVHYVCSQCSEAPEKLGATKLNKILWYVDTIAYCKFGHSLSGEKSYIKQERGPVPKRILPILQELRNEGSILINDVDYFGYIKRNYIVLKGANQTFFSPDERQLIDKVVRIICDEHTASSISELSHDLIWEAADIGEEIPVYAVLAATPGKITKKHFAWADNVIEKIT